MGRSKRLLYFCRNLASVSLPYTIYLTEFSLPRFSVENVFSKKSYVRKWLSPLAPRIIAKSRWVLNNSEPFTTKARISFIFVDGRNHCAGPNLILNEYPQFFVLVVWFQGDKNWRICISMHELSFLGHCNVSNKGGYVHVQRTKRIGG